MKRFFIFIFSLISLAFISHAQPRNHPYTIIAYYLGSPANVARVDPTKITHIIFSFCHLKGNRLHVASATDSLTIKRLVGLKKKNPSLKVLLSMGGWGGCVKCSDTFADSVNRLIFAESVRKLSRYFKTDGIDLDWEYPAVEGPPGHKFVPEDCEHFTQLLKQLRETLGDDYEISFAAGGFQEYLEKSIDWPRAMKFADRVNLMTYDLVNGNSVFTGHHTSLYSTPQSPESINNAVQYIIGQGVPSRKIVIGAAFMAACGKMSIRQIMVYTSRESLSEVWFIKLCRTCYLPLTVILFFGMIPQKRHGLIMLLKNFLLLTTINDPLRLKPNM